MPPAPAVVSDHWPLVRAGIALALGEAGIEAVEEVAGAGEVVDAVARTGAGLAVVTADRPSTLLDTVQRLQALARPPVIVALVDAASREDLAALVAAGVDGVLLRTTPTAELAAAVPRVLAGERVIAPALVGVVVGSVAPRAQAGGVDGARPLLTAKEQQVLARLAAGDSNRDIAATLFLAPATVKSHLANIYAKLDVSTRQDAVRRAVDLGLV